LKATVPHLFFGGAQLVLAEARAARSSITNFDAGASKGEDLVFVTMCFAIYGLLTEGANATSLELVTVRASLPVAVMHSPAEIVAAWPTKVTHGP